MNELSAGATSVAGLLSVVALIGVWILPRTFRLGAQAVRGAARARRPLSCSRRAKRSMHELLPPPEGPQNAKTWGGSPFSRPAFVFSSS